MDWGYLVALIAVYATGCTGTYVMGRADGYRRGREDALTEWMKSERKS